ncbi:DMT family transporter [Oceanivirga salmonicida]|uniref:DMT family transporter n=1 Tax=Oceanivirga salmonicida TaxID=1769291 RepID=UPI00082AAC78|nr:DMT family transporter [Oceanivirga salmonicida]
MIEGKLIYMILALVAGIAVTVQSPVNSALGKVLGVEVATFWTFLAGTVVIAIYFLIKGIKLPSIETLKTVPLWCFMGAFLGLIFVTLLIVIIPHLGAGTATVLIILSQIITALILDHFGLVGLKVKSFTFIKLIGVFLMTGGVLLISK